MSIYTNEAYIWRITADNILTRDSEVYNSFIANFFVALTILLVVKMLIIFHVLLSEAGNPRDRYILPLTSLLCFGYDIIGALCVSTLVAIFYTPLFHQYVPRKLAYSINAIIQLINGYLAVISYYCLTIVGFPLSKENIVHATLYEKNAVGLGKKTILSSVYPYIDAKFIIIFLCITSIAILCRPCYLKWFKSISSLSKKRLMVYFILYLLVSMGSVPLFKSGVLPRLYTYGIEKSPVLEFVSSYIKPYISSYGSMKGSDFTRKFYIEKKFPDEKIRTHQGISASPQESNLILIVLEAVAEKQLKNNENLMPFLRSLRKSDSTLNFLQHYTTWPQSTKSLFSIMCSEYPFTDYRLISEVNPSIPCVSFTQVLHDNGYATAMFNSTSVYFHRKIRFLKHRKFDVIKGMSSMSNPAPRWRNE